MTHTCLCLVSPSPIEAPISVGALEPGIIPWQRGDQVGGQHLLVGGAVGRVVVSRRSRSRYCAPGEQDRLAVTASNSYDGGAADALDGVEVVVLADDIHPVGRGHCGNPQIVDLRRTPFFGQSHPEPGPLTGCLGGDR